MNLIDAYVYEVTRRLPEKSREDIAMELRSTIEDMLPELPSEVEIKDALSKLGDPAILAARYSEKPMHLIGPKVYDTYIGTMKKIIPWAIMITILVNVIVSIVGFTGEISILNLIIDTFVNTIVNTIMMLVQLFFWVTILFVFIERVGLSNMDLPITKMGTPWTPEDLKHVIILPRKKVIPKGEIIFGIIWLAIWAIVYFNADHLIGVYQNLDDNGLEFIMPIFHHETWLSYWPLIVMMIVLELGLAVFKWISKIWTIKMVTVNAIIHLLGTAVFFIIISNPNVYNPEVVPYLANLVDVSLSAVHNFTKWLWWTITVSVIVSTLIEIVDSYRKAKIVS